ncbi:ShlB/FhaC/HecB family hemolysin secretion/activation protein [Cupriavidus sp. TMH.W2]|uniref:ShlB/FhaC/HecB family hemolysin secretion/activation protein n=1 Tax=Cupriavidus sp. TMH.W2 TaxID=3434465 RepID=UPI003D785D3F
MGHFERAGAWRALTLVLAGNLAHAGAQAAPDAGRVPDLPALRAVPDAGVLLDEARPPVTLPDHGSGALPPPEPARPAPALSPEIRVRVSAVRITGARAFSETDLQPLVAALPGGERSLGELEQAAQRITQYYRQHDYLLARAYLPAQEIRDGSVEIRVLEGRLGTIRLDNPSRMPDTFVSGRLAGLHEDEALRRDALERGLLLLNDTPGLVVRSTLSPGASVGTTDLDVRVDDGPRVNADASVDNYGNRFTGQYRFNASVAANNPLRLGDALLLRAITAGEGFNYGQLSYQLPVNRQGTRLGASYAAMHYRLGEEFDKLDAHGTAQIASVFLTHPLVRSRAANLNGQVSYDHKTLNDQVGAAGVSADRRLDNLTLGLSGDRGNWLAGGGITQGSLSLTIGNLQLDGLSAALDAAAHHTQGHFARANLQVQHLQPLTSRLSVYAQLSGQLAGNNLDSAEKMILGGAWGVRAYPQGEAPSDDAWLANLELRYGFLPQWQAILFYDAAQGWLTHSPIAADGANRRTLSGAGAGIRWANAQGFSLQATLAWRTSGEPTSDRDRTPRFWLQLAKSI